MTKIKRPMVVKAYLTHIHTPLITEILRDGRIRKVARLQRFAPDGWKQEQAELRATYGKRWLGVRAIRKDGRLRKSPVTRIMKINAMISDFVARQKDELATRD
jgi:hypothetical protein